jgi:hypothetical protein
MIISNLRTRLLAGAMLVTGAVSAQAALVSVAGPASSSGAAFLPQIIAAPSDTSNNATPYSRQVGFNENQGVMLVSSLSVDGGSIAAGLRVDSHMIYLERERGRGLPDSVTHRRVEWTFDGVILGVMSNQNGGREAASEALLGLAGTTYAQFPNRGLEAADSYSIAGNTLMVSMRVTEPGDWIRVVTLSQPGTPTRSVPETGGMALGVIGVLAVAGLRRHLRRTAA